MPPKNPSRHQRALRSSRRVASSVTHMSSNSHGFSHINIQERAPADDSSAYDNASTEQDFILKNSLQHVIEEQLLLCRYTIPTDAQTPDRPLTFAEAIMSTKNKGPKDTNKGDASVSGPTNLQSLGSFKVTLKKKKKKKYNNWSPFDLSSPDVDDESEVGSNFFDDVDIGSSHAASPPALDSALFPSTPQQSASTLEISSINPPTTKGKGRSIEAPEEVDYLTHQTPKQQNNGKGRLIAIGGVVDWNETEDYLQTPTGAAATEAAPSSVQHYSPLDKVQYPTSNTHFEKNRRNTAMASIAGAFGAKKASKLQEEVDPFHSIGRHPDLPSAAVADPPEPAEPVIATPRAYTTVGSLVDPNAVPQFTAPNRIQREGAGRRPLTRASISKRHQEASYFPPRDGSACLNTAQQPSPSPVRFHQDHQPGSSQRTAISQEQMSLTDEEKQVLRRARDPQVVAGNAFGFTSFRNQYNRPLTSTLPSEKGKLPEHVSPPKIFNNQDATIPATSLLPNDLFALSGLAKMQTIQRLAKFENPVQEMARDRLSALSVVNNLGRTIANPTGLPTSSASAIPNTMSHQLGAPKQGGLDCAYPFAPPGFQNSSISQSTPFIGAYGGRPSGIPQPLTAGPPGQRQYLTSSAHKMASSFNESRQVEGELNTPSTNYAPYSQNGARDPRSPWYNLNVNNQAFTNPLSRSLIGPIQPSTWQPRDPAYDGEQVCSSLVDSATMSDVSKYYPTGFPSNLPRELPPRAHPSELQMVQISGVKEPLTAAEKEEARRKEREDQFYAGQRAYGKTINDHLNDAAWREDERKADPSGRICPPPRTTIEKMLLTPEEMENMTIPEAVAPLLSAAFDRLLRYADDNSDRDSARHLSGFVKPDDHLVDRSAKGNNSFFGEVWGPRPQRPDGK